MISNIVKEKRKILNERRRKIHVEFQIDDIIAIIIRTFFSFFFAMLIEIRLNDDVAE